MPEQLLNSAQVGTTAQHVGGKAVSQCMRADLGVQSRRFGVLFQLLPETLPGQAVAAGIEKEATSSFLRASLGRVSPIYSLTNRAACS